MRASVVSAASDMNPSCSQAAPGAYRIDGRGLSGQYQENAAEVRPQKCACGSAADETPRAKPQATVLDSRAHLVPNPENTPMPSEQLRAVSAQIRAQRAVAPTGTGTVAEMRAGMETQQGGLALPADVELLDLNVAGRPARRVRTPGAREDRGTLYLHGGGYVMGSLNTHQELMGRVARATNAQVLGLDYRLAPEHVYPAAVEDALAAYQWILEHGIAASRVVIAGDSAGGGLALALLLALRERQLPMPAGAVLFSPWTDLTASGDSVRTRAEADPMIGPAVLGWVVVDEPIRVLSVIGMEPAVSRRP